MIVGMEFKTIPLENMEGGWDLMVKYDQLRATVGSKVKDLADIVNDMYVLANHNTPNGYIFHSLTCIPISMYAIYTKEM